MSNFLDELCSRGFYKDSTNLEYLKSGHKRLKAYIGFDLTATSLHVGSLIQLMIARLLLKHDHEVIILLGDFTTQIGDPTGKDDMRKILSKDEIMTNMEGIKATISKFGDFKFVTNSSWLNSISYSDFLKNYGKAFTINKMLTRDSVKLRLDREQPLTLLEFNYMILQAIDFLHLYTNNNCFLQIGGSDQWGNIVSGVDLIDRKIASGEIKDNEKPIGLTTVLLTTASGKKMGKTENGAVWLDVKLTTPFEYFQYFRNTEDKDVIKFLYMFTEISIEEIKSIEKTKDINEIKSILGFEATKICHGKQEAEKALQLATELFSNKDNIDLDKIEKFSYSPRDLSKGINIIQMLNDVGFASSNGEAKRLITGNGIRINNQLVIDEKTVLNSENITTILQNLSKKSGIIQFKLSSGKKRHICIEISLATQANSLVNPTHV